MNVILDTVQRAVLTAFGVVMGAGLAAAGLFALPRFFFLVVLIVGGFVSRSQERHRQAASAHVLDDRHLMRVDQAWSLFGSVDPDDWDDPWVDNGIELGNLSPERPGTIVGSLPMVQLNRKTGKYDVILAGYLKEEGGDN